MEQILQDSDLAQRLTDIMEAPVRRAESVGLSGMLAFMGLALANLAGFSVLALSSASPLTPTAIINIIFLSSVPFVAFTAVSMDCAVNWIGGCRSGWRRMSTHKVSSPAQPGQPGQPVNVEVAGILLMFVAIVGAASFLRAATKPISGAEMERIAMATVNMPAVLAAYITDFKTRWLMPTRMRTLYDKTHGFAKA